MARNSEDDIRKKQGWQVQHEQPEEGDGALGNKKKEREEDLLEVSGAEVARRAGAEARTGAGTK